MVFYLLQGQMTYEKRRVSFSRPRMWSIRIPKYYCLFLQHHYASFTRKLLSSSFFFNESVYLYIYKKKRQFFIGFIEVFHKCGGKLKFKLSLRELVDSVIYITFIPEITFIYKFSMCHNLFFDSGELPWSLNIVFLLQRCCHLYAAPVLVCVVH